MNTKWYNLGIKLKIDKHKLDRIETEHSRKGVERCLIEVVDYWQKNMDPSWEKLAEAVQNLGGYNHVVKSICEEQGWEYDSGCESAHHSSDSEVELSPACGCGNCDVHRMCTTGCPQPDLTRRVPILKRIFTDNATVTNVTDYTITTRSSCVFQDKLDNITTKFAKLVRETCESFKKVPLTHKTLVCYLQAKYRCKPVTEEVSKAEDMDDLFIIITKKECWWLEYDIIKELIEEFGSVHDHRRLRDYEENFKTFIDNIFPPDMTRIKLCQMNRLTGHKKFVVKVDREWESTSLKNVLILCKELEKIFEQRLHLVDISQGCVMLTMMVPVLKAVSIEKDLNRAKLQQLARENVIWFKIFNHTFTISSLIWQYSSSDSDGGSDDIEVNEYSINGKVIIIM